ncbi:MAG: hypothetical protein ACM3S0_04275 [Acidobacteriota bacterium]
MHNRVTRYAAGAAYISGIMGIVGFVSMVLFFALEAPQAAASSGSGFYFWGLISDISGPATMVPLLLVVLALHQIERDTAPMLSRIAAAFGMIGALAVTVLQLLLIFKFLTFEQEVGPVVLANAVVGVWLVLANHLARVQAVLSPRLAWLGIVVGMSFVLYPVIFPIVGGAGFYNNLGSNYLLLIVTSLIFLISYIGFPVWAVWLGRVWSRQRATARTEAAYAR